jgi:four helix bundle protein
VEGQAASSKKEYTQFFHYSLKSANESKLWLALLRDTNRAKDAVVKPLLSEMDEISNILASSI